jgi:predicted secreted hydrolase
MTRLPGVLVVWLLSCAALLMLTGQSGAATAARSAPVLDAPEPVVFPRDDGAHDSGIEWWYFTGHLFTEHGERYGFEYVVFRARDGDLEGYVSHFAITDNARDRFRYDQRIFPARGVAGDAATLDLHLSGWTMRGGDGEFALAADMAEYAMRLDVRATKPAALHDGDGYIDYGNGTASYYYSWTRMQVSGEIDLGDEAVPVSGDAWMDHQWGDFATYRDGGWDWFSIQLANGTDVMLYVIRDAGGEPLRVDGSIVDATGEVTALGEGDFALRRTGEWTSARTGTTYPSSWTIEIPAADMAMTVTPALPDQELDTRATTGVIYWEGEALVEASVEGKSVGGLAFVELTGYAPYVPVDRGQAVATPLA